MQPFWWSTKDGDVECLEFFRRHYTSRKRRRLNQFVGPGQKRVFRSSPELPVVTALFAWRMFIDDCIDERTNERQQGINCAIFRNESDECSSDLIVQADDIADFYWSHRRHYTYVDPQRVESGIPGYLFSLRRMGVVRGHQGRTIDLRACAVIGSGTVMTGTRSMSTRRSAAP